MDQFSSVREAIAFFFALQNTDQYLDLFQIERESNHEYVAHSFMGIPALTVVSADGRPKENYSLEVKKRRSLTIWLS